MGRDIEGKGGPGREWQEGLEKGEKPGPPGRH